MRTDKQKKIKKTINTIAKYTVDPVVEMVNEISVWSYIKFKMDNIDNGMNKILAYAGTELKNLKVKSGMIIGSDIEGNDISIEIDGKLINISKNGEGFNKNTQYVIEKSENAIKPNAIEYTNRDMSIDAKFNQYGELDENGVFVPYVTISVDTDYTHSTVNVEEISEEVFDGFIKGANLHSRLIDQENGVKNIFEAVNITRTFGYSEDRKEKNTGVIKNDTIIFTTVRDNNLELKN